MTRNTRSLTAIAGEIHKARSENIFCLGELLVEAKAACPHGQWLTWLDEEFEWSSDSAERYMAVAGLGDKFRKLRNLNLPKTILYGLLSEEEEHLPSIIDAISRKPVGGSRAEIEQRMDIGRARCIHGKFPDATLMALNSLCGDDWAAAAEEALKAEKPKTPVAAEKIVARAQAAYVAEKYKAFGALPDGLSADTLALCEEVPDERKPRALKLLTESAPDNDRLNEAIEELIYLPRAAGPSSVPPPEPEPLSPPPPPLPEPVGLDDELVEAINVIVHYARRPMPRPVGRAPDGLDEAVKYLRELSSSFSGALRAKAIADRAERAGNVVTLTPGGA